MDAVGAAAAVKGAAKRIGFELAGIARVEPLVAEEEHLREWLARGYHGTMGYMARNVERRVDVRRIVPDAKSVVVVALNYFTRFDVPRDTGAARVSRYAWGEEYHEIVGEKLDQLCVALREAIPSAQAVRYVDTGAVMEKAWAVRAGIGWMGKHTNVIAPSRGSWFFLGVVITDAELAPDAPIDDRCGTCTACLDACPTAAFPAPGILDASRCISYATIELKAANPIPPAFEGRMDGWVFGCDVCQDVCPWNSFAEATHDARFEPRPGVRELTLDAAAQMSEEAFTTIFAGSPVMRTKHAGFTRNARMAGGT